MIKLLAIALMVSVLAAGCTSQATGNVVSETTTTAPVVTTSSIITIPTTTTINGTTTTAKITTTTTTKPKPDLSVDIVEFQDGNKKPLMYVINTGDVEALNVRLRVDYSMPNNSSAKYACVYPSSTGSFKVEVGKIYQAMCNVSATIPGSYEVIAFVDPDNRIAETDETNNKFTTIVRIS